jgi:hypothetical protein
VGALLARFHSRRQLLANAGIAASLLHHMMPSTAFPSARRFAYQNMITWTLVIFVYSGSGIMIQSSITGYSSYAECNKQEAIG